MDATQCISGCRHREGLTIGVSTSGASDLLGFSHTQPSLRFTESQKRSKHPASSSSVDRNALVDGRGQWRRARLVQADRKERVTPVTTFYNWGLQKNISQSQHTEPWSRWSTGLQNHIWCHWGHQSTGSWGYRSHMEPNQAERWEDVALSQCLLQHSDGRLRICCRPHESLGPS